jgi:hypothetical protein
VGALLAAGCTDEGASEPKRASADPDQEVADAAVLDEGDFGPEWEQLPPSGGERPRSQRAIARCLGEEPEVLYPRGDPSADSPVFVSPEDEEVSSRTVVAGTEDAAMRRFELSASIDAQDCLAEELQRYLEDEDPFPRQDVEIGDVRVVPRPDPDLGDESVGYRVSVPLTAEGGEVEMHVIQVLVRVGRALVTVQATSLSDPFDDAALAQLAGTVVDRIDEPAVS